MLRTERRRLVGRTQELQLLREAVKRARAGRTSVVLVEGEAGIGKSRLLEAALEAYGRPDDVVLVGRGVPLTGGEVPFGLVADDVRDLVRREGSEALVEALPAACEALGRLVPEWQTAGAGEPDRADLLEAMASLVTHLSKRRLAWLVVDDLQWADASSRDVLAYLVRMVRASRLLVTCTVRDSRAIDVPAFARFLGELVREPVVTTVRLNPLSREEVAEQIVALAGGSVEPTLVSRTATLSQGVPFLVEELILGGLSSEGSLPVSVAQLMAHRLLELSETAVCLVQACSVESGRLWHRLLGPISGLDERATADACAEGVRAQVLEVDDTGVAYRFRHELLREAVHESLLPADRLRWHAAWARQLDDADSFGDPLYATFAAAQHWALAGDFDRAFTATVAAGEVARAVSASAELGVLLPRILELWTSVTDAATRVGFDRDQVLDETIDALIRADEWAPGLALIDRELAMDPDHPIRLTALRVRRGWFVEQLGRDDELPVDPVVALNQLIEASPQPLIIEALIRLGFELLTRSPDLAAQAHQRSVEVADQVGRPRNRLWARSQLALHLSLVGRPEAALSMGKELLDDARSSPAEVALVEADCAWWLCCLGRYREAVDIGLTALDRVGHAERARRTWAIATASVSIALFSLGRWDLASTRLARASPVGVAGTRGAVLHAAGGVLACSRGDLSAAKASASDARGQLADR
ncbi:MAG: AAA family ATPase, partial [Nocardioidaceae bacterium]